MKLITFAKIVVFPLILFQLACGHYGSSAFKDTDFETAEISRKVIEVENGFGYDIFVNGKLYIHMCVIPDYKPYKAFSSHEDAQKVADLVIEKLRKKEIPPYVKKEELDALGIDY